MGGSFLSFLTASAQTNAPKGFGAFIVMTGPTTPRILYMGTPGIVDQASQYVAAVLEIDDIILDGAPTVPVSPQEVSFSVRNAVTPGWFAVETVSEMLRNTYVLGCQVTLYAFFKEGNSWQSAAMFAGIIADYEIETDRIVFHCADVVKDLKEIPVLEVNGNAMKYGAEEGDLPKESTGVPVPIALGRFSAKALATWPTGHPFETEKNACILPHLLGLKAPCVPLLAAADRFKQRDGSGAAFTMRHAMFVFGDEQASPVIRLSTASHKMRFPDSTADSELTSSVYKLMYANLFTWNHELDRALPFCADESTFLSSLERYLAGAGEWDDKVGDATAASYGLNKAQFFYVNRTNPQFATQQDQWPGALQSIALPMIGLSEYGGTDGTGGSWFTSTGATTPDSILKPNFVRAASLSQNESLCLRCPGDAQNLGDIWEVRVFVLFDLSSTCDNARIWLRTLPDISGTQHEIPLLSDINSSGTGSVNYAVANPSSKAVMVARAIHVKDFAPDAYWPNWRFQSNFAAKDWFWEIKIKNATATPSDCDILGVWLEVVYKSRVCQSYTITKAPALPSRPLSSTFWYSIPRQPSRRRGAFDVSGLRSVPKDLSSIEGLQIFATAGSTCVDDGSGTYTGSAGAVIENPADIAHLLVAKYLGDTVLSGRIAAGTAFGSLARARTMLNDKIASGDFIHSVVISERTTVREILDEIGRQSMSVILRQPSQAGGYQWRMFTDSPQPQTDAPERLYRTNGQYFTWADIKRMDDTPRVRPTPLDSLATSIVLDYGWHEPTRKFAYSMQVGPSSNTLLSDGTTYQTAMAACQTKYGGLSRTLAVEAPWVWNEKCADALVKWYADQSRERRMTIEFYLKAAYIDLMPGHVIRFADEIGNGVTAVGPIFKYPGPEGSASWSSHNWNVVSVTVITEPDILLRVIAMEVYTAAA